MTDLFAAVAADLDEAFEERAAIAEHDGQLTREEAEAQAAEYRHRCEVRFVCSLGPGCDPFLRDVAKRRGQEAAERLRRDAREQYRRGNRGAWGDWRAKT